MSELELYNELFSKVQETANNVSFHQLDVMEVIFKDGDTVLQQWVQIYSLGNLFCLKLNLIVIDQVDMIVVDMYWQ